MSKAIEEGIVKFFDPTKGYGFAYIARSGYKTDQLVYFNLGHGYTVTGNPPWFGPRFDQRHGTIIEANGSQEKLRIPSPDEGDGIRFTRMRQRIYTRKPVVTQIRCERWAFEEDWLEVRQDIEAMPRRLRVVRVESGKVVEVLQEFNAGSGAASAHLLSARFPKNKKGSDPLSVAYAHRDPDEDATVLSGLAIESFDPETQAWQEEDDVRTPGRRVQRSLKERYRM